MEVAGYVWLGAQVPCPLHPTKSMNWSWFIFISLKTDNLWCRTEWLFQNLWYRQNIWFQEVFSHIGLLEDLAEQLAWKGMFTHGDTIGYVLTGLNWPVTHCNVSQILHILACLWFQTGPHWTDLCIVSWTKHKNIIIKCRHTRVLS